jgi:uncharacterized protein with PQ loop repeat
MTAILMAAVVVAANVLGASMAFPQARKLVRTRQIGGVSTVWAGLSAAMNAWWAVYGVATGVWAIVPVCTISFALYVVIGVVLVRELGGAALRGLAVGAVGIGVAPLPFLVVGGWAAAGVVIGFGYGAQLAPAVVAAHRTDRLEGVSAGTWILALSEAALWVAYGSYVTDEALLVGGAAGVLMATLILARLAVTGHRPFRPAWALS